MTKQERSVFRLRPSVSVSYNCDARDDCIFMKLVKWRKYEETNRIRPVDIHFIGAYFHRQDLCHISSRSSFQSSHRRIP